jgi:hypothetical protein
MATMARIPRRRGGLCGVVLIVLGAWSALVPFIGPYFGYAFTPDKAWSYTTGRLYLSVIPGAAALLGGLVVLATRSRTAGSLGGLLAALGGAWLIAGYDILVYAFKMTTITPGTALSTAPSGISPVTYTFLEQVGFFTGVGILVVFFGALAMGRFSMLAARDAELADYLDEDADRSAFEPSQDTYSASTTAQYPTTTGQYPTQPSRQ